MFESLIKPGPFLSHRRKRELDIEHARTVVSLRFSNLSSLLVTKIPIKQYKCGSVRASQIGKQLTSGDRPWLEKHGLLKLPII